MRRYTHRYIAVLVLVLSLAVQGSAQESELDLSYVIEGPVQTTVRFAEEGPGSVSFRLGEEWVYDSRDDAFYNEARQVSFRIVPYNARDDFYAEYGVDTYEGLGSTGKANHGKYGSSATLYHRDDTDGLALIDVNVWYGTPAPSMFLLFRGPADRFTWQTAGWMLSIYQSIEVTTAE